MKSKLIKLPLILLIRNKVCGRKTIHERIWKIMKDYSFDFACSFLFAVPPSIITKETSTDMVVREGSNVTLTCKASGYPEPYVMWRREDGKNINYNGESGESWLLIFFFPSLFYETIILKSETILIIRIKINLRILQSLYCYP